MKEIYEVSQNSDLTEGRGNQIVKGLFTQEEDAESFSDTLMGIMGTRQGVEVRPRKVYDSLGEHPSIGKVALRSIALNKLTKEEKEVLGLI